MIVPSLHEAHLEQICNILAHTNTGLTGREIDTLLLRLSIPDPAPTASKRVRLFNALALKQGQDRCGNNVIALVEEAMNPVRYHSNPTLFEARRCDLNVVLAFSGYTLREDGAIIQAPKSTTLSEAQHRARRLEANLRARATHSDVLRFCRPELLQDNYFHAVLEATKSVAEKIRLKSGLAADGAELADKAFGGLRPILAINTLRTETEQSEQRGFTNLLKGMFGLFRNVTAHAPKITWPITEDDALDLLSLASYLHRRIDQAVPTSATRTSSSHD
jgi:uncharacterized protein (TIGR02391 family)